MPEVSQNRMRAYAGMPDCSGMQLTALNPTSQLLPNHEGPLNKTSQQQYHSGPCSRKVTAVRLYHLWGSQIPNYGSLYHHRLQLLLLASFQVICSCFCFCQAC